MSLCNDGIVPTPIPHHPGRALGLGALRARAAATPTPTYGMASAGDVWLLNSHAEPRVRGQTLWRSPLSSKVLQVLEVLPTRAPVTENS